MWIVSIPHLNILILPLKLKLKANFFSLCGENYTNYFSKRSKYEDYALSGKFINVVLNTLIISITGTMTSIQIKDLIISSQVK